VIHGAEDRYVPVANAAALAGSIPGATLRVLDHAGHLVFIERFADVNREVVSFLGPRGSRKLVGARCKRARRQARVLGWIRKLPRLLGRWSGRLWDCIS
jgi:hypothetical protein